jgi:outer membrane protein assembly factor BamB
MVYVMSGYGRVVCFDAKTLQEKWAVDLREKFGAVVVNWGMVESLLVDGKNLICTPGGPNAGMVALDKKTGETAWVCSELSDPSGYCSPILIKRGDKRIIITFTGYALVGVEASTGKLLWRHERRDPYDIHAVSPVYEDGCIYVTSGYGGERGEMFELSEDGGKITKRWTDKKLDSQVGGVVVHEGYVYGASDRNRQGAWLCLNLKTGEATAETPGVRKGAVTYADGMLYGYGENGMVGLIKASPTDLRLMCHFRVTQGSREHWAHPVICNGRLYIRHGEVLMAYDVKAEEGA